MTKSGAGLLTLTAANTYTGATYLNGGIMNVSSLADGGTNSAIGASSNAAANLVLNGGTLAGTGSLGNVVLAVNSAVHPGATDADGSIGTLSAASLAALGGDLRFDLGTSSDQINIAGLADFSGPTTVSIVPGAPVGTYVLLSAGILNNASAELSLSQTVDGGNTFALDFSQPNQVLLDVTGSGGPANLVFTGSAGNGNWDINSTTNFTAGSGAVVYNDGDNVTFDDATNTGGQYNITLTAGPGAATNSGSVSPASVTVNTANTYTFSGAGIAGAGTLTKTGSGTLVLNNVNTYSGDIHINQGAVTLAAGGSIANTNVTVGDGSNSGVLNLSAGASGLLARNLHGLNVTATGTVNVAPAALNTDRSVVVIGSGGFANAGKIDLSNNDLIIQNGDLASVTSQLKSGYNAGSGYWNGTGIQSSTAANDHSFLTTLGVLQQSVGGTFDNQTVNAGDVEVKYTYYGDADLSGKVDGTDYSMIDVGFNSQTSGTPLSGWQNGDFNYDGHIDGSDYSLIDNAFNLQGSNGLASPLSMIATNTSEIAGPASAPAVPEPGSLTLLGIGAAGLLSRRRRK